MPFKVISYLEHPVMWSGTIYAILKEGTSRGTCMSSYTKFGNVVQEGMSFEGNAYLFI